MTDLVAVLLPPVFVLAGLGMVAFGAHHLRVGGRLRKHGVRVPGVVVRLRWQNNGHGGGVFYPTLRFQGPNGTELTVESDVGANPAPAREGQPVTVVYDPARPRRARPEGLVGGGTALGVLLVVFGSVAAVVAAVVTFAVSTG
ncbi:DUF3592 domain-containing protein [Actinomadura kijaniata]|uniref:DUF3592 domain-containing protein n=1 Tax=Actinomadura kijaniata TaxID=46161 RepID=UPI003F1D8D71